MAGKIKIPAEGMDYLGIFGEFNRRKIKYIVVGGIAVNLLDIPRVTYDVDILLEMSSKNIKKYISLLKSWSFKPKIPVDMMDFADRKKRMKWIKEKNMKAFNLYNSKWAISEIDVLIDAPVDYEKAKKNVVYKIARGIKIPVISVKDLIKMKKNTNRLQDESDIRYLRKKL
jgi:hypothetical protein